MNVMGQEILQNLLVIQWIKCNETCKTGYEYDNRGNITKHEIYYRERKDDPGNKRWHA